MLEKSALFLPFSLSLSLFFTFLLIYTVERFSFATLSKQINPHLKSA